MNVKDVPPLVVAVESALGKRVLALRYLPSPTAARAALAAEPSGRSENAPQVALDNLFQMDVAQPDLGRVLGSSEVDLAPNDESTR